MHFDFEKRVDIKNTYRSNAIINMYDLKAESIGEHFEGDIPIEDKEWSVGLIVGSSGAGKTTIAKQIFGDLYFNNFQYSASSVIDDMPKDKDLDEITKTFVSCGFGVAKNWLKPYSVLSNGEQMRLDLARCILEDREIIVFDEFTSVINRELAKVTSTAISRAVRRLNKKFVAISCHRDIVEYLQPDFIYDCDLKKFFFYKELIPRPKFNFKLYELDRKSAKELWERVFKQYHYLDTSLSNSAHSFCLFHDNEAIGFISVLHFPHAHNKSIEKGHRLVVIPSYQGIGIGLKLFNIVAQIYTDKGKDFRVTASSRSLVYSMLKSPIWKLQNYGLMARLGKTSGRSDMLKGRDRVKFSFKYTPLKPPKS